MLVSLLSCSKEKLQGIHVSSELYSSEFFQSNLNKLIEMSDNVFIISALHFLIDLDYMLNDYDLYLGNLEHYDKVVWGMNIVKKLIEKYDVNELEVVVVSNDEYFKYVEVGFKYYNVTNYRHENYYTFSK